MDKKKIHDLDKHTFKNNVNIEYKKPLKLGLPCFI